MSTESVHAPEQDSDETVRVCRACQKALPLAEFYVNRSAGHSTKGDGWVYLDCRRCHGFATRKGRREMTGKSKLVKIRQLKERPCADCGGTFPWPAMQFDHVRGEKSFALSKAHGANISWEDIEAEVAKCDIVCANCHHIRTWNRAPIRQALAA